MEIAILGAGVAGMSAALMLRRQGHRVRLYERRAVASTLGAGVVLWPNAGFVLAELGIDAAFDAHAGRPRAMRRFDRDGRALGYLDIERLDRSMGFPSRSILRRDLQAVLAAQLAAEEIETVYGACAVAIDTDPDRGAQVRFEDGSIVRADLIIGADGRMRSVARCYVVGDNAPVYQGFVNWIGIAHSTAPLVDEVEILDYWGCGERFGLVAVDRHTVYWAGARAEAEAHATAPLHAPQDEIVAGLFRDWPGPIGAVMRATPPGSLRKIAVHDLDPVAIRHRDNVVLIGDAAHAPLPTSGQGACQALEDAWHLARCLDGAPADLHAALAAFAASRAEKTSALASSARQAAQALFTLDPEACARRDAQVRALDPVAEAARVAAAWAAGLPLHAAA
ncbi:FAD-dependent oxidoreductase [Burkholderia sp. FERM BP-3421]|jgi:2-polyprenyl-6-methoxyphenol hydroxylase-like FAD-dependent oxidoreductase|uniref:FAD-dependent monooxygenase n=1 Tax=Burkholderia sp. FERM BP-3421 TaxID=1494466 RepID=UPI0023625C74|nr:FAD-dependent monooxygenase [Burkholderia sp. FERM BP-3421]WDD91674.1 FAD-dependent oxidoreductase [Burkholderia sp. FERM BP-3421]